MFQEGVLLSSYSTFGIGGKARYFAAIRSVDELKSAFIRCRNEHLPFLILGKGSNCLFDDRGFDGAVLLNKIDFIDSPSKGLIHVGSGYSFSRLGALTAREGLAGLEFASGIPGTVGGALFMNAGANGSTTADTLKEVRFLTFEGEEKAFAKEELSFGYRSSSFQTMKGAILSAVFALQPSEEAKKKQLHILDYRMRTQPYSEKSAGCVFQNPENDFAGALIEQCGLKTCRIGGAEVSSLHGNFIVNKGGAKAEDVLALIALIQKTVKEKTGKELVCEVRRIPYQLEC